MNKLTVALVGLASMLCLYLFVLKPFWARTDDQTITQDPIIINQQTSQQPTSNQPASNQPTSNQSQPTSQQPTNQPSIPPAANILSEWIGRVPEFVAKLSFAPKPSKANRPFIFFHTRKGGGSSLRKTFHKAANASNLKMWIPCESPKDCVPYSLPPNNQVFDVYASHVNYVHMLDLVREIGAPSQWPQFLHLHKHMNLTMWKKETVFYELHDAHPLPFDCLTNIRPTVERVVSCYRFRFLQTGSKSWSFPSISNMTAKDWEVLLPKAYDVYSTGCNNEIARIFGNMDETVVNTLSLEDASFWGEFKRIASRLARCLMVRVDRCIESNKIVWHYFPWLREHFDICSTHVEVGKRKEGSLLANASDSILKQNTMDEILFQFASALFEEQVRTAMAATAVQACAGNGVTYGDRFIQIGDWRIGDVDGNHFSVSHKGGQTSQIYVVDGTVHPGPRTDYSTWSRPVGTPRGVSFGDRFIQIGEWRIGDADGNNFSVSHKGGQTALICVVDGIVHMGPRTDFSTWSRPVRTARGVSFGDRFIQIGEWRIGDVDGGRASVSHKDGQTAIVHVSDGTVHLGPRTDLSTWSRNVVQICEACAGNGVTYGDRFIQIGDWRIGDVDGKHASVSHKGGQTSHVYVVDGTVHPGPRTDFSTWSRPVRIARGVSFGDRFIQIGEWRIGDVDGNHLSVSHKGGQTALIYRVDGAVHRGPRTDYSTWTRIVGTPSGISIGDRFIQIGEWRIGDVDGGHASVTHKDGQRAVVHVSDGTVHLGLRTDLSTWSRNVVQICEAAT